MPGDGDSDVAGKKRTMKACDRCRLKKVKCDGSTPCTRCRQDDSICQFNVRSSSDGKSVSVAHVNQLQAHNEILVRTLKAVWERYAAPQVNNDAARTWSVHDIVQHTGVLEDSNLARFSDSLSVDIDDRSMSRGDSRNGSMQEAELPNHSEEGENSSHYQQDSGTGVFDQNSEIPDYKFDMGEIDPAWSPFNDTFHQSPTDTEMSVNVASGPLQPQRPSLQGARKSSLHRPNRPTQKLQLPAAFRAPADIAHQQQQLEQYHYAQQQQWLQQERLQFQRQLQNQQQQVQQALNQREEQYTYDQNAYQSHDHQTDQTTYNNFSERQSIQSGNEMMLNLAGMAETDANMTGYDGQWNPQQPFNDGQAR